MTINKFSCEKCKYSTTVKDCISKHLLTKKHLSENLNAFECKLCEKSFKVQSGLWRHNNKFHKKSEVTLVENQILVKLKESIDEIKGMLHKPQPTTINNNIIINFNMNVFLKEHCNEALNMDNFINNIICEFGNHEEIINDYVKGSMTILKRNWELLPLNKRPMHCIEGEDIFHIRNNGEWNIDTERNFEKSTLHSALEQFDNRKIAFISNYYHCDIYKDNHKRIFEDIKNVKYKKQLFSEIMKLIALDTRTIAL